jgi:hypothetical protein
MDSPFRKEWTKKDWKLFEEAYKIHPDSPHSNKRIAKFMGDNVHPNHVAEQKKIYRKMKKNNKFDF